MCELWSLKPRCSTSFILTTDHTLTTKTRLGQRGFKRVGWLHKHTHQKERITAVVQTIIVSYSGQLSITEKSSHIPTIQGSLDICSLLLIPTPCCHNQVLTENSSWLRQLHQALALGCSCSWEFRQSTMFKGLCCPCPSTPQEQERVSHFLHVTQSQELFLQAMAKKVTKRKKKNGILVIQLTQHHNSWLDFGIRSLKLVPWPKG